MKSLTDILSMALATGLVAAFGLLVVLGGAVMVGLVFICSFVIGLPVSVMVFMWKMIYPQSPVTITTSVLNFKDEPSVDWSQEGF